MVHNFLSVGQIQNSHVQCLMVICSCLSNTIYYITHSTQFIRPVVNERYMTLSNYLKYKFYLSACMCLFKSKQINIIMFVEQKGKKPHYICQTKGKKTKQLCYCYCRIELTRHKKRVLVMIMELFCYGLRFCFSIYSLSKVWI